MKALKTIEFDYDLCTTELDALDQLLKSKDELSERDDIQPLFKSREQLSAFIGTYSANIGPATHLAFEFPFLGSFVADLVVGSLAYGEFLVIEFEDARQHSVFNTAGSRATSEWGRRFEHGFSQIVDWCSTIDDFKKTNEFKKHFGHGYVKFTAMLIIGRDKWISPADRERLLWRTEKVKVDSHTIECVTFDDLHRKLKRRLETFAKASKLEE